jgi:putative oxidoreductase
MNSNISTIDIFKTKLEPLKAWAPTILRVFAGFFFMMHGIGKIFGPTPGFEGFSGMITGMLGLPVIFAYLVAWGEFLGGISLILGFLTRYWAIYLSIIMLVATFAVHISKGLMSAELPLLFFAVLVSLFFSGAGKLSIDNCDCTSKQKR